MVSFLGQIYWNNSVQQYLLFAGILVLAIFFKRLLAVGAVRLLYVFFGRFSSLERLPHFVTLVRRPMMLFIQFFLLNLAADVLDFGVKFVLFGRSVVADVFVRGILQAAVVVSFTWLLLSLVEFVGRIYKEKAALTESKLDDQMAPFVKDLVKVLVIIGSVLFTFGFVFHFNITALIGGLGIGGLAVALAAQDTLGNLFASFTIFLDKPFSVGDIVHSGDLQGTVERIGFRSTRIRTFDRSFLTVPNKFLIDKPLNNITLSSHRRAKFLLQLSYKTTPKQLQNIVDEITATITKHSQVSEAPTVSFFEYGQSSLNVLVLFLVDTNEYEVYVKVREEINFAIYDIVLRNKAQFAIPSQVVYFEPDRS